MANNALACNAGSDGFAIPPSAEFIKFIPRIHSVSDTDVGLLKMVGVALRDYTVSGVNG